MPFLPPNQQRQSTLFTDGEIKKHILLMKVTAATDSPGSND